MVCVSTVCAAGTGVVCSPLPAARWTTTLTERNRMKRNGGKGRNIGHVMVRDGMSPTVITFVISQTFCFAYLHS